MKPHNYILNDRGEPVAEPDLVKWGEWFEANRGKRHVADDRIDIDGTEVRVSTVFLGIDHAWGEPIPVLWETMVFGGPMDKEMDRCGGSREQAEAMHARMLARVRHS
jgi:hypothetical protein